MLPLISIILPVYNGEEYLEEAIDSVLKQSYSNIELIIVDDGSSDCTYEIVEKYIHESKCKYIYQENGGAGSARNIGMDIAKGEYIAFIDADDTYEIDKIEQQYNYLKEHVEYGLVYCNVTFIDKTGATIGRMRPDIILNRKEDWRAYALFRQTIPAITTIMIRRKVYESNYRYSEETAFGEDVRFVFDISKEYNFGYIDKELYNYRKHENNITNNRIAALESSRKWHEMMSEREIEGIVRQSFFEEEEKKILLANIYMGKDGKHNYEKALDFLREGISSKRLSSAYYLEGICFFKLGDYARAKEKFDKSIALEPKKAEAYNNLACVMCKLGMQEQAEALLVEALHMKKGYMDAEINLESIKQGEVAQKLTPCELMKDLLVFA